MEVFCGKKFVDTHCIQHDIIIIVVVSSSFQLSTLSLSQRAAADIYTSIHLYIYTLYTLYFSFVVPTWRFSVEKSSSTHIVYNMILSSSSSSSPPPPSKFNSLSQRAAAVIYLYIYTIYTSIHLYIYTLYTLYLCESFQHGGFLSSSTHCIQHDILIVVVVSSDLLASSLLLPTLREQQEQS
jgi:hypothetical protein